MGVNVVKQLIRQIKPPIKIVGFTCDVVDDLQKVSSQDSSISS